MLVCENMHFSINPFCTRLVLTVFIDLWKQVPLVSTSLNQFPELACSQLIHRLEGCVSVQSTDLLQRSSLILSRRPEGD